MPLWCESRIPFLLPNSFDLPSPANVPTAETLTRKRQEATSVRPWSQPVIPAPLQPIRRWKNKVKYS